MTCLGAGRGWAPDSPHRSLFSKRKRQAKAKNLGQLGGTSIVTHFVVGAQREKETNHLRGENIWRNTHLKALCPVGCPRRFSEAPLMRKRLVVQSERPTGCRKLPLLWYNKNTLPKTNHPHKRTIPLYHSGDTPRVIPQLSSRVNFALRS